jgi:hypothetical protein
MRIELKIYPEGDLEVETVPNADHHREHGHRPIHVRLSEDDIMYLTEKQGESLFGQLGNSQKLIGQARRERLQTEDTEGGGPRP